MTTITYNQPSLNTPGFDEGGLYWYVYYFYKATSADPGGEFKARFYWGCENGPPMPGSDGLPAISRSYYTAESKSKDNKKDISSHVRKIKVYEHQNLAILLIDRFNKVADGWSYSNPIFINWSDLAELIPLGKTYIIWGTGKKPAGSGSLQLWYTNKGTPATKMIKDAKGTDSNGLITSKTDSSIVGSIDQFPFYNKDVAIFEPKWKDLTQPEKGFTLCTPLPIKLKNWCYEGTVRMDKEEICKANRAYWNDEGENLEKCNNKNEPLALETDKCRSFCTGNENKCRESLKKYCEDITLDDSGKMVTNPDKKYQDEYCGCYLKSTIYDDWTQPFKDAGFPADDFIDPQCYFPKCGGSDYKLHGGGDCPSKVTCLTNITTGSITGDNAVSIANECGINKDPPAPEKIEGAEGFFLQYNDDGKKRPTKKSWGIVLLLLCICIFFIFV